MSLTVDGANAPLVCVIVLNYNGHEHLEYCLPTIAATEYHRLKIIVVDNASTDDSRNYVRHDFPEVTLLESPTNRGWSGGNNLGIVHACQLGADYIILANNDIRVDKRWVSIALQVVQQDPRIGIVGFRICDAHSTHDYTVFESALQEWSGVELDESLPVGGTAMFIRASLFAEIGLIDEGFFAYAEDNDFEIRARKSGYRVVTTNFPVWHYGRGSFGRIPLKAASLQIRNNLRLTLKHDNLPHILYQFARHFAKGCLPFIKVDHDDPIGRRLRPDNIMINFAIFLYAVVWNLWHLPATLRRRREDTRRVEFARRHLGLN